MTASPVFTPDAAHWNPERRAALKGGLLALGSAPGAWSFAVAECLPPVRVASGPAEQNDLELLADLAAGVVHPAASVIKLPLMVLALRRVDAGTWFMQAPPPGAIAPLCDLLDLMITVSDNDAANAIMDAIGVRAADAEIGALGMRDTVLERRLGDPTYADSGLENRTTAADMAKCLALLLEGSFLSPRSTAHALDLLGRQKVADRMPALLEKSVRCRHKTGELRGVRHDVGILEFDGRRVLLAALGSDIPTASGDVLACPEATRVIGGAAALVVQVARSGT